MPTSTGSLKKQEFQKSIYICFIDYAKAFDYVDHNKLWKSLKEMGIPCYLTCLLRNLYAGQEATNRTGHGTILILKGEPLRSVGAQFLLENNGEITPERIKG